MGQDTKSLTDLSLAIQQNPNDAWALAHRGEIYRSVGRYVEALADLGQAIKLDPDYAWAIVCRGETFYLMHYYAKALADLDRAIELKPGYARTIAHRGVIYKSMKHYVEALADLDEAIYLNPDYAWALIHRADIYITVKRYVDALADIDRAIAFDPTIIPYWRGERGLVLNFLGRYTETIECCGQALREDPDDYIASYSLAVAIRRGQGAIAALTILNKTWLLLHGMEQTSPVRAGVLYRLGGLAALQGKREAAFSYLQAAIVCSDEPRETALHDPAWLDLRADPHFQVLTSVSVS